MSAQQPQSNNKPMQLHIDPELDTKYRDIFNLHITPEDCVIEFGTILRHKEGEAVILDRIAISPSNAVRLQQWLTNAIGQMQQRLKDAANKQQMSAAANAAAATKNNLAE